MLNQLLIFIICLFLFCLNLFAIPAIPKFIYLTQPDGTIVEVKQSGDENSHFIEDKEGYTLVHDTDGFLKYAVQTRDGHLVSSDKKIGDKKPVNLKKKLRPSHKPKLKINYDKIGIPKKFQVLTTKTKKDEKVYERIPATAIKERDLNKISNTKNFENRSFKIKNNPSAHTYTVLDPLEKVIVIRIEFSDVAGTVAVSEHNRKIFSNDFGSLKHYFFENSYGNYLIDGNIAGDRYYKSSHKMNYYGRDLENVADNGNVPIYELVREAVRLSDTDVDFSKYDSDGDGVVDHIIIIHSGADQAQTGMSDDIWSHKWFLPDQGELVDGVYIKNYIMVSEFSPLGVYAHEFFHDLGAPDLYDYDNDGFPIGEFCLMSYGAWLNDGNTPSNICEYLKMDFDADASNGYIGWLAPYEISDFPLSLNILPLNNWSDEENKFRTYRINTSNPREYFLVSYHPKQDYDLYLPDAGLLIWHIDESMPDGDGWLNSGQPFNSNYRINLISPDANDIYKRDAAFSLEENQVELTPWTNPSTNFNNGTYSNIIFSNISAMGQIMNCTVSISAGSVRYDSFVLISESNNNERIEESETAVFKLILKNDGTSKLNNLKVNLQTEANYITILDNESEINLIESNDTAEAGNFEIRVSDKIFESNKTHFSIVISDLKNNKWVDSFDLQIIRKFGVESVFAGDRNTAGIIFRNKLEKNSALEKSNYQIRKNSDSSIIEIQSIKIFDDSLGINLTTVPDFEYSTLYEIRFGNLQDIFGTPLPKEDKIKAFQSIEEEYFLLEHKSIHQIEKEFYKDYVPMLPPYAPVAPPLNLAKTQPRTTKIIYGYYPYWISSPTINWDIINTLAHFSIDIDKTGSIVSRNGWPNNSWLSTAHQHGVRIEITGVLFGSSDIATLLSSESYRTAAVNNLVNEVVSGNGDGICIDFEFVGSTQKDNFILFLNALKTALKSKNPNYTLSIAGPAVPAWYPGYDLARIGLACDYIFIMGYDFHYSGGNPGPVAPLYPSSKWGTTACDSKTVDGYLSAMSKGSDTMLLGVPYYGLDWPSTNYDTPGTKRASATARLYKQAITMVNQGVGRKWDSLSSSPYIFYGAPSDTHQLWYDDTQSLAEKYQLIKSANLKGTGMWAIGGDGTNLELWNLLDSYFGPPQPPRLHYVKNLGSNKVQLKWSDPTDIDLNKIYVYQSINGINFTCIDNTVNKGIGTKTVSGLNNGQLYYFYVTAVDTGNNESRKSEIYAVFVTNGTPSILVVHDDARYVNSAYSKFFASALTAGPYPFDYCDSIAVTSGDINPNNYSVVIWYCGRDSHSSGGTGTLSTDEQNKLKTFLNTTGKRLFISGQELGYDLDNSGYGKSFYNNFLKSSFVADDAGSPLTLSGVSGTLFDGVTFTIDPDDNGGDSGGAYDASYPDVISETAGGSICLKYNGSTGAAISYSSANDTKVVNFGFPFETITSENSRIEVISKLMNFFNVSTATEDSIPPEPPVFLSVKNLADTYSVQIRWKNSNDNDLHHINIYRSTNGINYILADTAAASALVKTVYCPNNNTLYYFYLTLSDNAGNMSSTSDTYCIRTSSATSSIVVVEDDNRYGVNNYAKYYGEALDTNGYSFDCIASEAVVGNTVPLSGYSIVIWFTGKDSNYGYNTFSTAEQAIVQAYLNSGGKLFVSGQEIGYELDYKNYGDTFYKNYFHTQYSIDDAGANLTIEGAAGGIFNGVSFNIDADNGVPDGGAYDATYPDGISAYNSGVLCMSYSSGYGAAVNYSGTYKIINCGFAFETITTASKRKVVMEKILEYFGSTASDTRPNITISPDSYTLIQGTPFSINLTATDNKDTAAGLRWTISDTDSNIWASISVVEGETDYLNLTPKLTGIGIDMITIKVTDSDSQTDTIIFTVTYNSTIRPDTPVLKYVINKGTGTSVDIAFYSDTWTYKYLIYRSSDGVNFTNTDTAITPATSKTITGLTNNTLYYFKILNVNSAETSSISYSDIYAVRTYTSTKILVVEDDNRYGPHNYINNYARALNNASRSFNAAAAEAIVDGVIELTDYEIVIWFCAKDSYSGFHTFTTNEQEKVKNYLDNGGKFFVSGNEIGYDLDYKGYTPSFYNLYLKADYGADSSGSGTLYSVSNTSCSGLSNFVIYTDAAGSTQGIAAYQTTWPDRFNFTTGYNGSSVCLKYLGNGWGAAIDYAGGFGINYAGKETSLKPAKLVHFGFGFECINDTNARNNVMQKILNFFDSSSVSGRINVEGLSDFSGATVALIRSDSTIISTDVSDNGGRFRFDFVNNGQYYLRIEKNYCLMNKTNLFSVTSADTLITVTLTLGDVVKDNKINIYDGSKVKSNKGKTSPDLNADGTVDEDDMQYIRDNFGEIGD